MASSAIASSLIAQLLLLGPQAVPWAAFVALHITHRECREAALQQLLQVGGLWAVTADPLLFTSYWHMHLQAV